MRSHVSCILQPYFRLYVWHNFIFLHHVVCVYINECLYISPWYFWHRLGWREIYSLLCCFISISNGWLLQLSFGKLNPCKHVSPGWLYWGFPYRVSMATYHIRHKIGEGIVHLCTYSPVVFLAVYLQTSEMILMGNIPCLSCCLFWIWFWPHIILQVLLPILLNKCILYHHHVEKKLCGATKPSYTDWAYRCLGILCNTGVLRVIYYFKSIL